MLICDNCGHLADENELEILHDKDYIDCGVGQLCIRDDTFYSECPCGGKWEQATECAVCGEWFLDSNYHNVCKNCLTENMTFKNALNVGAEEDCKEKVKINGYLAYEFTTEQIEKILKRELAEAKKLTQLKHDRFLALSLDSFASWLIDNI